MKKHGVAVDLAKRGGELGETEGEEVKLGCIICGRPNKNDTLANKYKKALAMFSLYMGKLILSQKNHHATNNCKISWTDFTYLAIELSYTF